MAKQGRTLRVTVPDVMIAAVDRAARRQMSNISVYTRQALLARLQADGLLPPELAEMHAVSRLPPHVAGREPVSAEQSITAAAVLS